MSWLDRDPPLAAHLRKTTNCYCFDQRKPCGYHEGFWDGWDAALVGIARREDQ